MWLRQPTLSTFLYNFYFFTLILLGVLLTVSLLSLLLPSILFLGLLSLNLLWKTMFFPSLAVLVCCVACFRHQLQCTFGKEKRNSTTVFLAGVSLSAPLFSSATSSSLISAAKWPTFTPISVLRTVSSFSFRSYSIRLCYALNTVSARRNAIHSTVLKVWTVRSWLHWHPCRFVFPKFTILCIMNMVTHVASRKLRIADSESVRKWNGLWRASVYSPWRQKVPVET